ncbi:MAG: biotin transporter BioY [Lachnospiraceae bacterium]|nr:biotin transporter BioY [Lachnospiraceae bacterium]MBQ4300083.1 biotin transporter BioY [Lachnospiraceae bacterium]
MKKTNVYQMATCAIMAALLCVLAPLALPIGPVPISLATLVVYLAAYILEPKWSVVSVAVYLLLGLVGLPVFSGGKAGVGTLVGPTGGYLIGYLFLALISGIFIHKVGNGIALSVVGMIIATAVLYLFGTVWFVKMMDTDVAYAMSVCVLPFIPGDIIKIVAATLLGKAVTKALNKADLLPQA